MAEFSVTHFGTTSLFAEVLRFKQQKDIVSGCFSAVPQIEQTRGLTLLVFYVTSGYLCLIHVIVVGPIEH